MSLGNELLSDFKREVTNYGQPVLIQRFTTVKAGAGSWFDDDVSMTPAGSEWTYGKSQPVNAKFGSTEARLVEEGQLLTSDKAVFLPGDVSISGQAVKIGIGSPTPVYHKTLDLGIEGGHEVNGVQVYQKAFLRILTNGSLAGE